MLFCVLPLLDLRFQDFFELVNFVERLRVTILVALALLLRLLLYLLLNRHVVVLEIAKRGLELHRSFFRVDDCRRDEHV